MAGLCVGGLAAFGGPFGVAAFQADGVEAVLAEEDDGFVGEEAVGAAAVGDDALVTREFVEARGQVFDGDGHSAGDVTALVLQGRTDVEEHGFAALDEALDFGAGDVAVLRWGELGAEAGDLGEALLAGGAEGEPERENAGRGEAVGDGGAAALGLDEAGVLEDLEMLGGVGDGHAGLGGKGLDAPGGLSKQVDEFEAPLAGEGVGDAGELGIEAVLEIAMGHGGIMGTRIKFVNCSINRLTRAGVGVSIGPSWSWKSQGAKPMARCIDCPCGHVLRGADDEELFHLARKHVDEDHPEMKRTDAEVRARVAADARDA